MHNYLLLFFYLVGIVCAFIGLILFVSAHQEVRNMIGRGSSGIWSESSPHLLNARSARFEGGVILLFGIVLCIGAYLS